MSTQIIKCTIKGISPLLMHAYPLMGQPDGYQKWPPEKQAEFAAYRTPDTQELYIPGLAIQRCLVNAATYSKGKGRASLQKPVAACVMVTPEYCLLGKNFLQERRRVCPLISRQILLLYLLT
jgi:hypothetical protein